MSIALLQKDTYFIVPTYTTNVNSIPSYLPQWMLITLPTKHTGSSPPLCPTTVIFIYNNYHNRCQVHSLPRKIWISDTCTTDLDFICNNNTDYSTNLKKPTLHTGFGPCVFIPSIGQNKKSYSPNLYSPRSLVHWRYYFLPVYYWFPVPWRHHNFKTLYWFPASQT